MARKPLEQLINEMQEKTPLHLAIMELAHDFNSEKVLSSNQQCVKALLALKTYCKDWQPPIKCKNVTVALTESIAEQT